MQEPFLNFQNILVIDFGQLGDVILSLPALAAVRERFPKAKITLLLGKPGADVVAAAGVADDQILVDRVRLRDGNKLRSIADIFKLVGQIRRRRFDLVIDLHSLAETNILGFLSGAKYRLYANRENRSIDRLGRFTPPPPKEDKAMHYADRYLDVLGPLGIENDGAIFRLTPLKENVNEVHRRFDFLGIDNHTLIGLFPGAGHLSRRWPIENFVELAGRLSEDPQNKVLVFLGPEENDLRSGLSERFAASATLVDETTLLDLFTMMSFLTVWVSSDTGPMHLAAVAGTNIVLISEEAGPGNFRPLTDNLTVLDRCGVADHTVDEVDLAVRSFLND